MEVRLRPDVSSPGQRLQRAVRNWEEGFKAQMRPQSDRRARTDLAGSGQSLSTGRGCRQREDFGGRGFLPSPRQSVRVPSLSAAPPPLLGRPRGTQCWVACGPRARGAQTAAHDSSLTSSTETMQGTVGGRGQNWGCWGLGRAPALQMLHEGTPPVVGQCLEEQNGRMQWVQHWPWGHCPKPSHLE